MVYSIGNSLATFLVMSDPKNRNITTYLYRITNQINGNDYVGITVNLQKRLRDHKRDARLEPSKKESLIAKAIRKHGVENFKFEMIGIANTWDIACDHEKLCRYFGMGKYNRTGGGEGVLGHRHSDETRAKMSAAKLGKKREITPEHRAKLVANGNARKGIPKTEEHRANMSRARTGYLLGPRPQEVKDKISKAHTGRKLDPERVERMKDTTREVHAKHVAEHGCTETAMRWTKVKELGLKNLKELAEYERTHKTKENK